MQFINEFGQVINHLKTEYEEQVLADRFIEPDDVVLELGARYGTVTVAISKKLSNSSNCVSVEPDERVWEALDRNLAVFKSNAHVYKGFVSKKPLALTNLLNGNGYGTTAILDENSKISRCTLDELQTNYNLKFTALVADCEGFLEEFINENPELLSQLHTIIFEADYPNKCNYTLVRKKLTDASFRQIKSGFQNVWKK